MNKLLEQLNMTAISADFDAAYYQAASDTIFPTWLTPEFVTSFNTETNAISLHLPQVLLALDELVRNPNLVLFAKTVFIMLKLPNHKEVFHNFSLPQAPSDVPSSAAYDVVALFPLMAAMDDGYHSLLARGIDPEIVNNTYRSLDGCIDASSLREGKFSLSCLYFLWSILYVKGLVFNIRGLNFEICPSFSYGVRAFSNHSGSTKLLMSEARLHRSGAILGSLCCTDSTGAYDGDFLETRAYYEGYETDTVTGMALRSRTRLDKSEWNQFLGPDDAVISVHIPAGFKLKEEACEAAYEAAREFFGFYFPEYRFRAFLCHSWLLSCELPMLLPPDSRILNFRSKYFRFPVLTEGIDVFIFVFELSPDKTKNVNVDMLPETTSLMRRVKSLYQRGGSVGECAGVFPFEVQKSR